MLAGLGGERESIGLAEDAKTARNRRLRAVSSRPDSGARGRYAYSDIGTHEQNRLRSP